MKNNIERFIKRNEIIFTFILAMFLFSFGMIFLYAGRHIYGSDAGVLWASGIITYLGLKGFAEVFLYFWGKKK